MPAHLLSTHPFTIARATHHHLHLHPHISSLYSTARRKARARQTVSWRAARHNMNTTLRALLQDDTINFCSFNVSPAAGATNILRL